MPKKGKGKGRKSGSAPASMRLFVSSNRPTGSTTSFPSEDLVFRRQNMNIVQTPPRQMSNQIFWTKFKADTQITVSSTAISENNYAFTASFFTGSTTFLSSFDQYCIHSVVVTISSNANVSTPFRVWTAIDYDSVGAIGLAAIQNYSTCAFASVAGGGDSSHERLLYPCVAPQVTNSSNLPVPGGVGRMWLDSAFPTVNHYGIRTIIEPWVSTGASAVEVTFTGIFGFRNGI